MKLSRIFITGLFISFLGTLPLGTLNIAALQISISDGIRPAIYFALGALLIEVIYVRISLVAMDWVRKRKKLFHFLEWFTVLIISALAVSSFIAAADPDEKKNVILSYSFHRFWLGVILSALNPVQIPFWFGWSTVLFTKKILLPKSTHYNIYILGIGVGTFIGNLVFIFGGRLLVDSLNNNQHIIQYAIGSIFAITAILMFWKMIRKKDAISEMKDGNAGKSE
ncbi:MAG: LysE family transporter [Chitinophagaceae bacterium]|nr:LysE family transporter [Chitinophagaceae bacterium]